LAHFDTFYLGNHKIYVKSVWQKQKNSKGIYGKYTSKLDLN